MLKLNYVKQIEGEGQWVMGKVCKQCFICLQTKLHLDAVIL